MDTFLANAMAYTCFKLVSHPPPACFLGPASLAIIVYFIDLYVSMLLVYMLIYY